MDFKQLCEERYSVRQYTSEPVSKEDLDYILACARLAPSACNRQPWKFVIAQSEEAREKVCGTAERFTWMKEAPLFIIGYRNTEENWIRRKDGKQHGDIDLAIATEHICLAATEKGLGTCWVCAFDPEKMKDYLPMQGYEAVVIIPLGHIAAEAEKPQKIRKETKDIVEFI